MSEPPLRSKQILTMSLVMMLAIFALSASAASLGPITVGSIFTQQSAVEIDIPDPPPPIVSTDFWGCTNFIDGWTDESGAIWTSHSGDWQCLGSGVVRAQQREPLANLSLEIAESTGIRITTDISDISHQNNRSGLGISVLGDGAGSFLYVIYEREDEQVTIGVPGLPALELVTGVGDIDAGTMSVELVGDQLHVEFGSTSLTSIDLTEEAPQLIGNKWFGLVADNDNQSRFDNFTIELLP